LTKIRMRPTMAKNPFIINPAPGRPFQKKEMGADGE